MTRKRKKPESVTNWFKPVSKTPKNDSNEQTTELVQQPDFGLEVMAVIEEDNENKIVQTDSSPSDNLDDIKSKLVKEFEEKLASHGFKLNSTLDLVSSEIVPSTTIETEILPKVCVINEQEQPSEESKVEIVKQFRPPANFKFPSKKIGTRNRSCQPDWFEKWKFLHYTGYLIAKCIFQMNEQICKSGFRAVALNRDGPTWSEVLTYSIFNLGFYFRNHWSDLDNFYTIGKLFKK